MLIHIKSLLKHLKHVKYQSSINNRLLRWSMLITSIFLCVLYLSFHILYHQYMIKNHVTFNINTFNQSEKYVESYINTLDSYVNKVLLDEDILKPFSTPFNPVDSKKINQDINFLDASLNSIFFSKNSIDHIIFLGKSNFPYIYTWGTSGTYAGDHFILSEFIDYNPKLFNSKSTLFYNGENSILNTDSLNIDRFVHKKLIYCRTLNDSNGIMQGVIILCINPNLFNDIFVNSINDTTMLYDESQELVFTTNKAFQYSLLNSEKGEKGYNKFSYGHKDYIHTQHELTSHGLELHSVTLMQQLLSQDSFIFRLSLIYAFICLLFVYTSAYLFSKRITTPLQQLSKHFEISDKIPEKIQGYKKHTKASSLKVQLLLYFIVSTVIPVSVFGGLLVKYHHYIFSEYLTRLATDNMYQAEKNIDTSLRAFEEFTIEIAYNDIIQDLLYEESTHVVQHKNLNIDELIADIRYTNPEFVSLKLFNHQGEPAYSSRFFDTILDTPLSSNMLNTIGQSKGKLVYMNSPSHSTYNPPLMSFIRQVKSKKENNFARVLGYLTFYTKHSMLNNIIQDIRFENSGYVFLVDENNQILNHYNKSLSQDMLKNNLDFASNKEQINTTYDGEKYRILVNRTSNYNIKLVGVIPENDLNKRLYPIMKLCILIIATCLFIVLIISSLIAYQIIHPLLHLQDLMNRVSNNDFTVYMPYTKKDEISILSNQFNHMVDQLNKLIEENYETKIRQKELMFLEKEAQLNALQQQINPHFLYNTLESINWMAYKKDAHNICDMVTALGDFFRGNIANDSNLIPFKEEIDHLKNYIYIQEIRYHNRLSIIWEVDEDILHYKTIKLLLQPLVENAIVHGISKVQEGGTVTIKGYKDQEHIHFSIQDNGLGMDYDTLQKLNQRLVHGDNQCRSVGLANVYRRLRLCFNTHFTFTINSQYHQGTVVDMTLPLIK